MSKIRYIAEYDQMLHRYLTTLQMATFILTICDISWQNEVIQYKFLSAISNHHSIPETIPQFYFNFRHKWGSVEDFLDPEFEGEKIVEAFRARLNILELPTLFHVFWFLYK